MTIISRLAILYFLATKLRQLVDEKTVKETLTLKIDVILNPSNYTLSETDFDVAISFDNFLDNSDGRNYFTPYFGFHSLTFDNGQLSVVDFEEKGVLCGDDKFKAPEKQREAIGINRAFCSPRTKNYKVSGQWSSRESEFVYIAVKACDRDQDEFCEKSFLEVERDMHYIGMNFFLINKFFDWKELNEDPVKVYMEYYYYGFA